MKAVNRRSENIFFNVSFIPAGGLMIFVFFYLQLFFLLVETISSSKIRLH